MAKVALHDVSKKEKISFLFEIVGRLFIILPRVIFHDIPCPFIYQIFNFYRRIKSRIANLDQKYCKTGI